MADKTAKIQHKPEENKSSDASLNSSQWITNIVSPTNPLRICGIFDIIKENKQFYN